MSAFSRAGWETNDDELQRLERERRNAEEHRQAAQAAGKPPRPKFWLDMSQPRVQRGGSRQRPRKVDAL